MASPLTIERLKDQKKRVFLNVLTEIIDKCVSHIDNKKERFGDFCTSIEMSIILTLIVANSINCTRFSFDLPIRSRKRTNFFHKWTTIQQCIFFLSWIQNHVQMLTVIRFDNHNFMTLVCRPRKKWSGRGSSNSIIQSALSEIKIKWSASYLVYLRLIIWKSLNSLEGV